MDTDRILNLMNVITHTPGPMDFRVDAWLSLLATYRQHQLLEAIVAGSGWKVLAGPFAGLDLEGCRVRPPHLLGAYEAPLHSALESLIARRPEWVVNIGCAFGYYAVGLALRLPEGRIAAHDSDPAALDACRATATRNGTAGRTVFGGELRGDDFAAYPAGRTLVLCDIEGGERDLLDPVRFPALAGFDLLVELHQDRERGTRRLIEDRFAPTHEIAFVPNDRAEGRLPPALWEHNSLDQVLALWEGRKEPTPWLVMTPKPRP